MIPKWLKRIIAKEFVTKELLDDVRLRRDDAQRQQRYQHQYKHDEITSRLNELERKVDRLETIVINLADDIVKLRRGHTDE